jgi:hypothetical protein
VRHYPDIIMNGTSYPQPTCNCVKGNAANSLDAELPSVWANRAGSVYVGGDDPHYITCVIRRSSALSVLYKQIHHAAACGCALWV